VLRIPEYEVLRENAGIVDRSDRGVVRLEGADRRTFLQGLLTNDVQALTPGSSCYAAWLTPQGRMIADMHVLETGDHVLLDVKAEQATSLAEHLDKLIFTEDVHVRDASTDYRRVAVVGPNARAFVEQAHLGDPQVGSDHFQDAAWVVPVFEVFISTATAADFLNALHVAGAVDVPREAFEVLRIESGVPLFGVDMDEDTIPLEAGIENRAISFTKGCYVGQEVIIRVLHRGHGRVAKKLVPLTLDVSSEDHLPAPKTTIVRDGKEIGRLTSVAWSPALGKGVALGYVHRDFVESAEPFATADGAEVSIRRLDAMS
jgi:folate-binding protein YgfZ